MDDLGEVNEFPADLYEFINVRSHLSFGAGSPLAPHHQSLLASSSEHGILYAAVGCTLRICSLSDLRDPPNSSSSSGTNRISDDSVVTVDLASEDVSFILHILLFFSDSILIVLAVRRTDSSRNKLLFLHVTALSDGRIFEVPRPQIEGVTNMVVSPVRTDGNSALFAAASNLHVHVYQVFEKDNKLCTEIPVPGALSIALSDDESLLAIGTARGNIVLYNPLEGTKVGTVVEVESGWQPFQVYFAGELDLFVSYQREQNANHVMWHLARNNGGVSVKSHSPFGELCYAVYLDDDGAETALPPHVMFSYISDWGLAVVTSTKSSDIEVIARLEDGSWANYKLGDKREAILPIVDGDETLPIGMAFDFNDTTSIPARDPDDPDISPMPTLVIMTNTYTILSYRLVDDHRGAQCRAVRRPSPLPTLPLTMAVKHPTPSQPVPEISTVENAEFFPGAIQHDDTSEPKQTSRDSPNDDRSHLNYDTSSDESSDYESGSDASESHSSSQHENTSSFSLQTPQKDEVLPDPLSHVSMSLRDSLEIGDKRDFSAIPSEVDNDSVEPGSESSLGAHTLPTVHLEPNFNQALNAMKSDPNDPLNTIRSMIHEMNAELEVTRKASHAMWEELDALKEPINSSIDEVRKDFDVKSQELHKSFETEKQLRISVQDSMQKVLKLYREYETIRLEDDVRRKDASSFQLPEEYKMSEEKMARREAEIEQSIRYIDEKLNSANIREKDHMDPAEKVQMIYSSISLQGLRIRRVLTLLESLSERVQSEERISRRTELGLSLARLEKLSLESKQTAEVRLHSSAEKPNQELKQELGNNDRNQNNFTQNGTSLLPAEICQVLRRLAMRGGRESISVDTPVEVPSALSASRRPKERPTLKRPSAADTTHSNIKEGLQTPRISSKTKNALQSAKSALSQPPPPPPIPKPPLTGSKRTEPFTSKLTSKPPSGGLPKKSNMRIKTQEAPFTRFGNSPAPLGSKSSKSKISDQREGWDNTLFTRSAAEEIDFSKTRRSEEPKGSTFGSVASFKEQGPSDGFSLKTKPPASSTADDTSLPTIDLTAPTWTKPQGWASIQTTISEAPLFPLPNAKVSVPEKTMNEDNLPEVVPSGSSEPSESRGDTKTEHASAHSQGYSTKESSSFKTEAKSTNVPIASLPPDDDDTFVSHRKPPYSESKKKTEPNSSTFSSTGPERKGSLFASLPPDDDADSTPKNNLKPTPFSNVSAAPSFSLSNHGLQNTPDSTRKREDSSSEIGRADTKNTETLSSPGAFGSRLRFGGESKSPQPKDGNEANLSATNAGASGSASTFGTTTFSTGNAFGFGSSENMTFNFPFSSSSGGGLFGSGGFGNITAENTSLFNAASSKQEDMSFKVPVTDPNPINGGSTDDSEEETDRPRQQERMDTLSTPVQGSGAFGEDIFKPFGFGVQSANASGFAGNISSGPLFSDESFGGGSNSFGGTSQSANAFGSSLENPGVTTGQSAGFSAFGQSSILGQSSSVGHSPFGATSSLGFGTMSGFDGMSAKFGESNFGSSSAPLFGTPNSGARMFGDGANASPFADTSSVGAQSPFGSFGGAGISFSGTSGSASAFASLAASGPLPVFGNGQPPSFTSPAFSQRRA